MAKRYDQMFPLIEKVRPQKIVEVGVHKGIRAAKLCDAAKAYVPVEYVGYDVFDTMNSAFQEAALNGKGAPSEQEARRRLGRVGGNFKFRFVIGDTRKTLHGKKVSADFAFIDGDHRIDAIEGDYEALAGSRCVVFDDYYTVDEGGRIPDLSLYGANFTVDRLKAEGKRVEILPEGDRCKHGGNSHLAVVWL